MSARTQTADWRTLETFAFGDTPAKADELGALVVAGRKTTTCWSVDDGQQTHVGKRMVVLDGQARPWAVIETLELTRRRLDEVDWAFASGAGEGDRDLDEWRDGYRRYFAGRGLTGPDLQVWCERFRVEQVLDREGAR